MPKFIHLMFSLLNCRKYNIYSNTIIILSYMLTYKNLIKIE